MIYGMSRDTDDTLLSPLSDPPMQQLAQILSPGMDQIPNQLPLIFPS